jgi:hypothetical protein
MGGLGAALDLQDQSEKQAFLGNELWIRPQIAFSAHDCTRLCRLFVLPVHVDSVSEGRKTP